MLWPWLSPQKREQFRLVLTQGGPSRPHNRYAPPCAHGVLKPLKKCGECRRDYFRRYYKDPEHLAKHRERTRIARARRKELT